MKNKTMMNMTEQERMRMMDDFIINQSRKSDNNQ